jgi:hypothetical protein
MADATLDLWPTEISVHARTPAVILRMQARLISGKTQGFLEGDVTTVTSDKGSVSHVLYLVAPSLANYRYRVLSVTHPTERAYPAEVSADCFDVPNGSVTREEDILANPHMVAVGMLRPRYETRTASDDGEFLGIVRQVLRSTEVRSTLASLLAKINEGGNGNETGQPPHGQASADPI